MMTNKEARVECALNAILWEAYSTKQWSKVVDLAAQAIAIIKGD